MNEPTITVDDVGVIWVRGRGVARITPSGFARSPYADIIRERLAAPSLPEGLTAARLRSIARLVKRWAPSGSFGTVDDLDRWAAALDASQMEQTVAMTAAALREVHDAD